jgi:hypothetical protein
MRLTSKEAVMNWYYCREVRLLQRSVESSPSLTHPKVMRRFRSKIRVRLDAVTLFIFIFPASILAALVVRPRLPFLLSRDASVQN